MSYTNGLDDPTLYFNTKLYTGNNTTDTAITGIGFQPDWVWVKRRSSTQFHGLYDSVRGATKQLATNSTSGEDTNTESLKSFDSDGFTIGTSPRLNASSETYVGWSWLAGGTASSNTDGSITSSVSANTTAGFSIVSYTGTGSAATVGHGLSSAPSMIITKNRTSSSWWGVFHASLGNTKSLYLNVTNAAATGSEFWNNTSPTSSVFTVNTDGTSNENTKNYIAYCFAEKKGYSKFGSYTGNGNADGTFIYTGFKPAWVMIKRTDSTSDWYMYDNKRDSINVMSRRLEANNSDTEVNSGTAKMDFVSNGIKFRGTDSAFNVSSATYIYMAFAESPFVTGASGIPTTAR